MKYENTSLGSFNYTKLKSQQADFQYFKLSIVNYPLSIKYKCQNQKPFQSVSFVF